MNSAKFFSLFENAWIAIRDWVVVDLFAPTAGPQLFAILIAFFVALGARYFVAPRLRAMPTPDRFSEFVEVAKSLAASLILPITWWLGIVFMRAIAFELKYSEHLFKMSAKLLTAWIVINIASRIVRDRFWRRLLIFSVWTLAALDIIGLLQPVIALLDGAALKIGESRISIWLVIKAGIALIIMLQLVSMLSSLLESRIKRAGDLSPSIQLLLIQIGKIALFTVAVLLALELIGVDLTALAVFTGALGLGIGFGLQKVVSNLFSGLLLLIDRSIKPGDVVSLANGHGRVNKMGARFVSVITPDGIEHLIPNEKFITDTVENWSYSDHLVKLVVPVGVSYMSDLNKVIEIVETSASEIDRVLSEPAPACRLIGFGDSSVDFNAFLWISDPQNGVYGPRHQFLMRVWDRFHEEGIEIPFPQQDLHLRSVSNEVMEKAFSPKDDKNKDGNN